MNDMKYTFEILELLTKVGGRKEKIEILRSQKSNEIFKQILYWTYGGDKYGYHPCVIESRHFASDLDRCYKLFSKIIEKLKTREVTGYAAEYLVVDFLNSCSSGEAMWYARILNHDLCCGIGVKTINSVWEPEEIWGENPYIPVQLAKPYFSDCWKSGRKQAEPKLDGVRVAILYKDGVATGYSRGGYIQKNIENVLREVEDVLDWVSNNRLVMLDGEMLVDGDWGKSSGLLKKKHLKESDILDIEKLQYNIFDFLVLDNDRKCYKLEQNIRTNQVHRFFMDCEYIKPVRSKIVSNEEEAIEFYEEMLELGYEGLILKDLYSYYHFGKKAKHWIKMKPVDSIDGKIIGFEEGNKSNKGRLGAIVVQLEDGRKVKVGIGFSAKKREQFWKEQNKLLGKWLELRYQADKKEVAVCRFPRFIRIREDRDW